MSERCAECEAIGGQCQACAMMYRGVPDDFQKNSREIAHTVRLGDTWQPPASVRVIAITPERSPRHAGSVRLVLIVVDIPTDIG